MNYILGLATNGPKEEAPQPGEGMPFNIPIPVATYHEVTRYYLGGLLALRTRRYRVGETAEFTVAMLNFGVWVAFAGRRIIAVHVRPGFGAFRQLWRSVV
jgi:hypothetical protein